jgi:hypothetical protein
MNDLSLYFNNLFEKEYRNSYNNIYISQSLNIPENYSDNNIIIKKEVVPFGKCSSNDLIKLFLTMDLMRSLGLLLISIAFNKKHKNFAVLLNNNNSELNKILIEKPVKIKYLINNSKYEKKYEYKFSKTTINKDIYKNDIRHSDECISIQLTNNNNNHIDNKTILNISGSTIAYIIFADLLLNLSMPSNHTKRLHLTPFFYEPRGLDMYSSQLELIKSDFSFK